MTASCAMHGETPRCTETSFISWWLVGILLGALGFLLPTFSDACGEPPVFESMTLKGVPKSLYSPREKIHYNCKPGYRQRLFHSTSTYCEENNMWHLIPEGCTRKECSAPNVSNGGILDPNFTVHFGFQFDKEFHFYCDEGYYLRGENILTCKRSGDNVYWNYDVPKCEKIFCQSPGKIKNGQHTNSWRDIFEYNELVTYSCDPSNESEEYSLVGDSKLICSGPDTWSTDPPECKVVKCEYPVLKNGRLVSGIKEKFYYQAVVLFECLKGFYLHGSNPVFCGENNTWEPEMPTCIKGFKPTHPTKPPLSRYPGYPNPSEFPLYEDFKELDPGIIAVIILTILVGIAVICTCLYKCLRRKKKG